MTLHPTGLALQEYHRAPATLGLAQVGGKDMTPRAPGTAIAVCISHSATNTQACVTAVPSPAHGPTLLLGIACGTQADIWLYMVHRRAVCC